MKAVLLMAHGAPNNLEEVEEYVLRIRHGRTMEPEQMAIIKDRYRQIGGSPLRSWTEKQAMKLQAVLSQTASELKKVYIGMRHSSPYVRETVQQMQSDGVTSFVAICLAPQFSKLTIGAYQKALEEAIAEHAIPWKMVGSYAKHPALIHAFTERLRETRSQHPDATVLFTAHSLPQRVIAEADPYDFEVKETARLVAGNSGLADWRFAYQSQGMTSEAWLGPTVEKRIEEFAAQGKKEIIVTPIGFVCDHVEILYDVDMMYRDYAAQRGIHLYRIPSLNDSAEFIETLRQLAISGGL